MSQSQAVYLPSGAEGYELCHPTVDGGFQRINLEINGDSKSKIWKPLAVRLIGAEGGSRLRRSDSPWLGVHALIFRQSVVNALGEILRKNGELLPLACAEEDLFIFNPTNVLNALDEGASSLTRFESGAIMMVRNYVFLSDEIEGVNIFKLQALRVSPTFLSQKIVDLWQESGLEGLEFKRV